MNYYLLEYLHDGGLDDWRWAIVKEHDNGMINGGDVVALGFPNRGAAKRYCLKNYMHIPKPKKQYHQDPIEYLANRGKVNGKTWWNWKGEPDA